MQVWDIPRICREGTGGKRHEAIKYGHGHGQAIQWNENEVCGYVLVNVKENILELQGLKLETVNVSIASDVR